MYILLAHDHYNIIPRRGRAPPLGRCSRLHITRLNDARRDLLLIVMIIFCFADDERQCQYPRI